MKKLTTILLLTSPFLLTAQDRLLKMKGNTIEFAQEAEERVYLKTDSRIKEEVFRKITTMQWPIKKLNGTEVIFDSSATAQSNAAILFKKFIDTLRSDIEQLPDGNYALDLDQVLIDASGKVVFYDTVYNCRVHPGRYSTVVPLRISRSILEKMTFVLDNATLSTPKRKGKPAPSLLLNPFVTRTLSVEFNKLTVY